MALSDLKSWLNSPRDYASGVKLYQKYGSSDLLKRIFAKGPNRYNEERLEDELIAIFEDHEEEDPRIPDPPSPPKPDPKKKGIYPSDDYNSLPDQIQKKIQRVKYLYKVNGSLVSQLDVITDDHDRAIMANTVLDQDDEIRTLLEQIDHFKAHGKIPDPSPKVPLPDTEVELDRNILRIRKQISYHKNRNPDQKQKITDLNEQLEQLEEAKSKFY